MLQKKEPLAQQTANTLYAMIMKEHAFSPGEKLPNEVELAARLEIGRSTLREAVSILCNKGILTAHRGRGTFVAEYLPPIDEFDLSELSNIQTQLRDIFEMRLLYEPRVAAIACRRASDEEIRKICEQGERVAEDIRNGEDRTADDQEFHRLITAATHNKFLMSLVPIVNHAIRDAIRAHNSDEALALSTLRDHEMVMDFLKRRDSIAAQNAMEIHIHHTIQALHLDELGESLY